MTILAAHRATPDALIQVIHDEDFGHDFPIFWVVVRDRALRETERHERGTEQAARDLANARWQHYRQCRSVLNHAPHGTCRGLSYETSDLVDDA
jgi:hypothetical protein